MEDCIIRPAKRDDSESIWRIRNHPLMRRQSGSQEEIPLEKHNLWFENQYFKGRDNYCFVLQKDGLVVGYCRFDSDHNNQHVVSIALDPDYQGKGLGYLLLNGSLKKLRIKTDVLATVRRGNKPSLKLFSRSNFEIYNKDKKNIFFRYRNTNMKTNINLSKKTPIIVIGFGSIGKRHYNNLLKLGYKNLAVFDPLENAFLGYKGINRLKKLDEKIAGNFEIAIICSPNNLHIKQALICARAGCHIFVEKPLSHNLNNIARLIEECEREKLITMVGCNMRFHPCLQFIKNYLDKKRLRKIYSIQHEFGYYLPYWRPNQDYTKNYAAQKSTGGGIILDDIHEFDLLFWLNNFEKALKSRFVFNKVSDLKIETEDICFASFEFKNGIIGLVRCDYLQRKRERNCKIVGEKGNLLWNLDNNKVVLETKNGSKTIFSIKKLEFNDLYIDEIRYFFRCVASKKETFNGISAARDILLYCLKRK